MKISGEEFDLREWANALLSADFGISLERGEFVLRSRFLDGIEDPKVAREQAGQILQSVNGVSRLRLGSQEPFKIVHLQKSL